VATGARAVIYPDGCRDVIWRAEPGRAPEWFLTDLDLSVRAVDSLAGTRFVGFRLAPGAVLSSDFWRAAAEPDAVTMADWVQVPGDLAEVMAAAAEVGSVTQLARASGLGVRTLHRRIVQGTGQPPGFWLRLARLRRALRGVGALADVACAAGFADQAHFSRECRRVFGQSPARLLADPQARAAILAPGFGG
jgi:AraC-like DNA-binding protein